MYHRYFWGVSFLGTQIEKDQDLMHSNMDRLESVPDEYPFHRLFTFAFLSPALLPRAFLDFAISLRVIVLMIYRRMKSRLNSLISVAPSLTSRAVSHQKERHNERNRYSDLPKV